MIVTFPSNRELTPKLEAFKVDCGNIPVTARVSRFSGASGVCEYHVAISPAKDGMMEAQLDWVLTGYRATLHELGLDTSTAVLRRFHCSDLANQRSVLAAKPLSNPRHGGDPCAVSWFGQPPAPPVKVALLAYHIEVPDAPLEKLQTDLTLAVQRGNLTHLWSTGFIAPDQPTAYDQTMAILGAYDAELHKWDLALAENTVRTWFVVRDVDLEYGLLVEARKEFFAEHGLTPETHFIASTGIGGNHVTPRSKVVMDAYAIAGLTPSQVGYLTAPEYLSPTHVYGVTFERGASVAYRDRKHIIISGTASIDSNGEIVHPGNVSRQFDRTIKNMEALMRDAGATLGDLAVLTVYIRDPSDHDLAWSRIRECFGDIPVQVVAAPVCRPGWLIEIEGWGVIPASIPELPAF